MAMVETTSNPLRRYLATNSTATAFAITDGTVTSTIPSNMITLGGWRGIDCLQFFGAGSANQTFDYRLYGIERIGNTVITDNAPTDSQAALYEYRLIGSGTATLGAKTGVSGGVVSNSELIVDTLTWTASAYGTYLIEAYLGADADAAVFNPQSDSIASLTLLDLGNLYGIVIDFDMTGATSGNALIRLGT